MALRDVFIVNLKKFRKARNISQMNLAEKCNTAASYIGEIEIGRKFPSIDMIEKFADVLDIEAYRFFIDDSLANAANDEAALFFAGLTPELKRRLSNKIINTISDGLDKALMPEGGCPPKSQKIIPKRPRKKKGNRR